MGNNCSDSDGLSWVRKLPNSVQISRAGSGQLGNLLTREKPQIGSGRVTLTHDPTRPAVFGNLLNHENPLNFVYKELASGGYTLVHSSRKTGYVVQHGGWVGGWVRVRVIAAFLVFSMAVAGSQEKVGFTHFSQGLTRFMTSPEGRVRRFPQSREASRVGSGTVRNLTGWVWSGGFQT